MPMSGRYDDTDGHPVVRFERTYPHPVTTVWDAVTDPARLAEWFPTSVEFTALAVGEPIAFRFAEDGYPPMEGVVRDVRPPDRLVFTWGEDELTFALAEADGGAGCRLSFTVALGAAAKAARDAAGWDDCLDMLGMVVSGATPERPWRSDRWQARYDEYKRQGFPATAPIPQ